MRKIEKVLLMSGVCLVGGAICRAQGAPPGPLPPPANAISAPSAPPPVEKKPEAKPRNNIMGDWKLNQEQSDDPHEKLQQARENSGSNRGGGGISGPRIGFPGGGMGGGQQRSRGDDSDALREMITPTMQVNLSQKTSRDPQVDLIDESGHKIVFYTDGRKLQKSNDPSTEEISAKWDGTRLVTDEKGPRGKFSRTYELSSDGLQLWEEIKVNTGRGNYPVTIRYVYDAVDKEPGKTAAAPNQPSSSK